MGVAWSRAGPVATGTLLTGLATALQPQVVEWLPYNQGGKKHKMKIWMKDGHMIILLIHIYNIE